MIECMSVYGWMNNRSINVPINDKLEKEKRKRGVSGWLSDYVMMPIVGYVERILCICIQFPKEKNLTRAQWNVNILDGTMRNVM